MAHSLYSFVLPCSPTIVCQDRFDLLDSDEVDVPFWRIIETMLANKVTIWIDLLELMDTIVVTLRGSSLSDYQFLRDFLQTEWASKEADFFENVWPTLVRVALEMPRLFPQSTLPLLSEMTHGMELSRRQVACLVIHQFLCSLSKQPWPTDSSPDFSIWYTSDAKQPKAARAYLCALFTYFERLAYLNIAWGDHVPEWPLSFSLRTSGESKYLPFDPPLVREPLCPLVVDYQHLSTTAPAFLGLPDGACVVSANKNVGFGETATQEEMQVGATPECCAIVLFVPTLQDDQILIVRGAEAMISMKGHGREACLDEVLLPDYNLAFRPISSKWQTRTMLFMDALELDLLDLDDQVVDFLPGNVDREVAKAYTAFSSHTNSNPYSEIVTGLWGCGAFGGDREVKSVIQWCAASMAHTSLRFVCSGSNQADFAARLQSFRDHAVSRSWKVKDILIILLSLGPNDAGARDLFTYLMQHSVLNA
ncbi:hypothetical protein AJ80_02197 [Polytolypa hystricis UAMH7299]|uniref:poly(ADP-ribose) glycohydrolase n=1 Tax=Polytolypa hystricis (strain UAMH7299) TaxID=1447883 RepID=A0A2B7YT16_POLH7|nr:hypothetical protein AJ80_02197 [Polytolypa hystricis UAMH7299]